MRIKSPAPRPSVRRSWAERDRSWSRAIHRASAWPAIVTLLALVSWLADGIVWVAVLVALPWVGGASGIPCAERMVCLGLIDLAVYKIVKRHFARPRPFVSCPGIRAFARSLDEHSFPSGHTMHAVAFAVLLSAYYPAIEWIVWPFASLVALSRVVLGLHFPSDVVVGAVLGFVIARSVLVLF